MHSNPNCCRNVNQNNEKSNTTSQTGHPHRSTNNKCRRELAGEVTVVHVQWKWTWQQPLKSMASACQKKRKNKKKNHLSREPVLGSDIRTPGLISWESHHSKNTCTPTFTAALLATAKTEPAKCPLTLKVKEDVLHTDDGWLLSHEKAPLKLWNYATGH